MRDIKRTFFDILLKTSPFTRIEEFICKIYCFRAETQKVENDVGDASIFLLCPDWHTRAYQPSVNYWLQGEKCLHFLQRFAKLLTYCSCILLPEQGKTPYSSRDFLHGKQIKICSALWDGIPRRLPDSPTARGGIALYHKSALGKTKCAFCV